MPGSVQSVERAAAILRTVASGRGRAGLSEIAASLDLARSTTHGLLRTLESVGFVEQHPLTGRYALAHGLRGLGPGLLDVNVLRARAVNWADPLAARSNEAVRVGAVHDDTSLVVVHHVFRPDDSDQTLDTGAVLPLHASALGKVLLAARVGPLPSAPLPVYTVRTISSPAALAGELTQVRQRGWALESEELTPGTAAIAAPLRAAGGLVVGALGISGHVDRLLGPSGAPRPRLVTLVREAAHAVSRDLEAPG